MDWRNRRYFVVILPTSPANEYDHYLKIIKAQSSVKLHPPTYPSRKIGSTLLQPRKFADEHEGRGYYHTLVSYCPKKYPLLPELFYHIARECAENGRFFKWKEIFPKTR